MTGVWTIFQGAAQPGPNFAQAGVGWLWGYAPLGRGNGHPLGQLSRPHGTKVRPASDRTGPGVFAFCQSGFRTLLKMISGSRYPKVGTAQNRP